VLRAHSAFFQSDVIAAVLRRKACFSITARLNPPVRKANEAFKVDAWTAIKYTNSVWDEHAQRWISDAEVAEIAFTAFTSLAKTKQVTARLIVRLPSPAVQRPRPGRPLRATARAAPAHGLVLRDRLDTAGHDHPRRTTTDGLTHPPVRQDQPGTHVETTGPPGTHTHGLSRSTPTFQARCSKSAGKQ